MENYLLSTRLLNYKEESIQKIIEARNWLDLKEFDRILEIYNFVRDDIKFGYNSFDCISATKVIKDGYGQCNTKGILFMALLRAVNIPCRIHGFWVSKELQKGALSGIIYKLTPDKILHSWVEIYFNNKWYNLEGCILDKKYLSNIQSKFKGAALGFCGYGVAIDNLMEPKIEWNACSTYIQKNAIVEDLGIFDTPDEFLEGYSQNLSLPKQLIYKHIIRFIMNYRIKKLRLPAE